MPLNPDAFADMVTMAVKTAMAPVMERLAATEARLAMALEQNAALPELRDRVVTIETKSAFLPPPAPVVPPLHANAPGV